MSYKSGCLGCSVSFLLFILLCVGGGYIALYYHSGNDTYIGEEVQEVSNNRLTWDEKGLYDKFAYWFIDVNHPHHIVDSYMETFIDKNNRRIYYLSRDGLGVVIFDNDGMLIKEIPSYKLRPYSAWEYKANVHDKIKNFGDEYKPIDSFYEFTLEERSILKKLYKQFIMKDRDKVLEAWYEEYLLKELSQ